MIIGNLMCIGLKDYIITRIRRRRRTKNDQARNDENTKKSQENFRVFQLSYFRDKKIFS